MRISDWSSVVCSSDLDGAQAVDDHVDAAVEIGTHAVELVDEAHARHAVLVGLAPHRLRLRLDTGNAVEQADRAVEHAQRTFDFDGEVDVAGGVDDVDAVRSEEHKSELQSLMRSSYAVFCLK